MPTRPYAPASTLLLALLASAPLLANAGCADRQTSQHRLRAPHQQPVVTPHAKKLYALAEQRYAEHDYGGAVALWRQVFLQLPSDPSGDALRHKLVARMAHALTQRYTETRDPAPLRAAQGLLTRYLEKHEALFGDGPEGVRARWELVGMLVEIESVLEAGEEQAQEQEQEQAQEPEPEHDRLAVTRSADAPPPKVEAPSLREHDSSDRPSSTPRRRARVGRAAPRQRAVAGEDGVRVVEVGGQEPTRHKLGFIDNRGARAFMLNPGLNGASVFDTDQRYLHGPRVLVRLGMPGVESAEMSSDDRQRARAHARATVVALRPAIASCFTEAMGRAQSSWTRVTVDFTMLPDGRIERVSISDGVMLDVVGDLCLLESFERARSEYLGDARVAARVPLTVFFQPGFKIDPNAMRDPDAESSAPPNQLDQPASAG